jgi:hypothetical protein
MMTLQRALLLSESLNANLLWITYLLNFLSVPYFLVHHIFRNLPICKKREIKIQNMQGTQKDTIRTGKRIFEAWNIFSSRAKLLPFPSSF